MKFFAFEEWAAASAAYDADEPPYWHAKVIPDAFTALSGVLWSASYILMATRGFKNRSYAMPIYSLCLNIAWETVFGFFYGPGLFNQIVFAQWMIIDAFLVYTTIVFGKEQWKRQPLVANNLRWIMLVGYVLSVALHLSIAGTFIPIIGRRVVAFTAWPLQVFISVGSFAQLISRGHTQGHSWGIWWTRMLGTLAAASALYWRGYYWPERFDYVFTPYRMLLLFVTHVFDLIYPIAFIRIQREEARNRREGVKNL